MYRRKSLIHSLAILLKDYAKHCSLHGFHYFHKSTNSFIVFVWAAIITCSMVLCAFLCLAIFTNFMHNPTLTVVESTHFPMTEIPFPAVTVCDTEMVYEPNSENITRILRRRGYNEMQINNFYRSIADIKKLDYSPRSYVKKMHAMLNDLGITYNNLLDMVSIHDEVEENVEALEDIWNARCNFGPLHLAFHSLCLHQWETGVMLKKPCDALLVECMWRSKEYNCSDMFRSVFIFSGYCCQFDMQYFKNFVDEATTFASGIEITEALEIVVNGQKHAPNGAITDGYVLLYLFNQENMLTFLDNSVVLTPSAYFDVNVGAWTIDASDYVKELPVRSRKCLLKADKSYGAGFYHGCIVTNIMRRVVDRCRCIPFDYNSRTGGLTCPPNTEELEMTKPIHRQTGSTLLITCVFDGIELEYTTLIQYRVYQLQMGVESPCTWERLPCIYENLERVLGDMRSVVSESECYQPCDHLQYEISLKYIREQSDTHNNYSKFSVHYDGNTCMKYRREILYTWDKMLANLGGIFGLCLGGSVISIIEIIWLILDIIYTVVVNWAKKKVSPYKKQWQKDFVLKLPSVPVKNNKVFVARYKYAN